mmetsp:Transcript_1702/g.4754  ORF Transcript_1702/g.4754 Transcript_1702/m.4754 type:complete len:143 (+) Transcript_1702:594-1022(+)
MPSKVAIFARHYTRLFSDPRMAVLFDTEEDDANVSAQEHGRRLALFLLARWTGDDSYYRLGRGHPIGNLYRAHQRAKACPLRHGSLRGRGFTEDQRDSWLGHLYFSAEDCGAPEPFRNKLALHLASVIDFYAPWERAPPDQA